MPRRWFVIMLACALAACGHNDDKPAVTHDAHVTPPVSHPAAAPVVAVPASGPASPVIAESDYVGSEACADCHAKEAAAWHKDWHARALTPAKAPFVAGTFPATFHGSSSQAEMKRGDHGAYLMRTAGPDGATADWPIAWLVGGKRMQDTITVFADGRWQLLPVYFHVTDHTWVDYTESKQGALTPDHPFYWSNFRRTANRECLDCHTTGTFVRYDEASRAFSTKFADAGVACESCHGPGKRHADTEAKADIFDPAHATAAQQLAVCGQCHSPRNPLYPLLDGAHRFRAGDRYDDRYQALVLVDGPDRSGDYFADGRPKTSSFELAALLQSKCARKGGATCLTCHGPPHGDHGKGMHADELRAVDPDASCRGCHTMAPDHSKHRSKEAQRCVACHMPPVVKGVLDTFADHAIDVPAPSVTAKHGVPNACNACHQHEGKTPAEMDAALAKLWPGAADRQARRVRLADAIDEATAKDSRAALEAVVADRDEAAILRGACAVLLAQRFRVVAPVVAPLLEDVDPLLRARGAEALGYARVPRGVVDRVAELATSDPSLTVRQAAMTALTSLGDPARADRAARALIATADGDALPQPHLVIGFLASRRGELELAERELSRVIALVPYHADARVWLAEVYLQERKVEEGRRELEAALRFAPDHAVAKRELASLPK